jgi:hypothetical protein
LIIPIPYLTTRDEIRQQRRKIILSSGALVAVVAGLTAAYLFVPSIGIMLKSMLTKILG